jgi:CubicO group peptidase (beta-lactamase class C family)
LLDAANGKKGNGNSYYGINTSRFNAQIGNHLLVDKSYPYLYSNFGISTVGSALAAIYGNDFVTVMNNFIVSELVLKSTRISDGTGDLDGYWKWNADDAYIPAGGIVSTISDMMRYVNMQMTGSIPYLALGHTAITEINATTAQYAELGIRMDSAGIGWILDKKIILSGTMAERQTLTVMLRLINRSNSASLFCQICLRIMVFPRLLWVLH